MQRKNLELVSWSTTMHAAMCSAAGGKEATKLFKKLLDEMQAED